MRMFNVVKLYNEQGDERFAIREMQLTVDETPLFSSYEDALAEIIRISDPTSNEPAVQKEKVQLCFPMRGRETQSIVEQWEHYARVLSPDFDVMNTIYTEFGNNEDKAALWYLGWSLQQMQGADAIILFPDYELADGCVIESYAADKYGKGIYHLAHNTTKKGAGTLLKVQEDGSLIPLKDYDGLFGD